MQLNLTKPLAFFDLETTGLDPVKDRIVEISIVRVAVNGEKEVRTKRINPGIPIPAESSVIHGIRDEDVREAPSFKQVAASLAEFLQGCDLAGFNMIKFDLPMLTEEFLRAGIDFDVSNRKLVDAQKIFYLMEPRTLTAAYKFYCNKDLVAAHSAEADTLATHEILLAQIERYQNISLKDKDGQEIFYIKNDIGALHKVCMQRTVDLAGRIILNDNGEEIFNFGKFKNTPVSKVFETEPGYYDWMMKGDFPLDTKRKITEIKLRGFGASR